MVEQRQSGLQRIQVGIIGLVVVLLFVSLANMVLDRVTDTGTTGEAAGSESPDADKTEVLDEPLAELGVTPVAKEDDTAKAQEAPATTGAARQLPQQPQQ